MPRTKGLLWALALALALFTACEGRRSSGRSNGRDSKFISIFNVVTFKNLACTTSSGLLGTCLTATDCSSRSGGVKLGNCAAGFGVCCLTTISACGSTVADNCTYIQNPGYPSGFDGTTCQYTLKQVDSSICQIRLDYENFSIRGPNTNLNGDQKCSLDSWTITGSNNMAPATPVAGANHNPPVVCGIATGQHMYMDVGGSNNGDLTVAFTGSATGTNRIWNVKVSQIPCGVDYAPPIQCGQWLTGVSGNVKSFNFDVVNAADYAHLPDQEYRICVRQEPGYCGLRWTPTTETKSFTLSGAAIGTTSSTGKIGCGKDYVEIPQGKNLYGVGCAWSTATFFTDAIDRYCGSMLSCLRASTDTPVYSSESYITFVSDIQDETENAAGTALELNQNRGFSLNWLQTPC